MRTYNDPWDSDGCLFGQDPFDTEDSLNEFDEDEDCYDD